MPGAENHKLTWRLPAIPGGASMSETVSLDTIRAGSSERSFPCDILPECQSGIAFFCAAFYGRNDVIHLFNHGVQDLWLNDMDEEKLAVMGEVFGVEAQLLPGDSFTIAKNLREKGGSFDLVLCDPFTNLMKRTLVDEYENFAGIACKWFVTGASGAMFAELGIEPTAPALTDWLRRQGHDDALVDRLVMRNSDYQNGVYWVVLKRPETLQERSG